jgi:hypothetical protein
MGRDKIAVPVYLGTSGAKFVDRANLSIINSEAMTKEKGSCGHTSPVFARTRSSSQGRSNCENLRRNQSRDVAWQAVFLALGEGVATRTTGY